MGARPTALQKSELIGYAQTKYPGLFRTNGTIDLTSLPAQRILQNYKSPKAFDRIGYARSLGGFFYEFFYGLLGAILTSITYTFLLSVLFPWPESRSMADVAGVLFSLLQTIFNIPTSFALGTFVGEYRIKNPLKMVEYIRFYIWFQMMSGIILVTSLSYFVLNMFQTGNLVWAKWLMLILISREYPAITDLFISLIRALQKFDFEGKLNFIKDTVVKTIFQFVFVLWGKLVLGANPEIGPLFGIAIGDALGSYLAEFVNMAITSSYLNRTLKSMGFTIKDLFIPQISRDVINRCLKFGIIVSIPSLISSAIGTITTLWWYNYVPAYITFITLSKLADEIANVIKAGGGINVNATVSESINNGKKELTSYYISMMWKFVFFFKFAIGAIVLSFIPLLLEVLLTVGGAENYLLATIFITPNIIATLIEQPQASAETVIIGAQRPLFNTVMAIIQQFLNIGFTYLWLIILQLPKHYGIDAVVWILPMGGFIPNLLRMVLSWWYIDRKIAPVRIKQFTWQTFIAPIFPALIVAGIAQLWSRFIFYNLIDFLGGSDLAIIIVGVITVVFAFVGCAMFIFFPLYCAFGGWDTNTMAIFDEAVAISGPSKFLFLPINKTSHLLEKISPLHNRFPIPYVDAIREAEELMQERYIKDLLTSELENEGKNR